MTIDYEVGDIIEYRTFFGDTRRVLVGLKDEDIKNGHPGFDGFVVSKDPESDNMSVWGYDDQIIRKVG